MIKLTEKMIYIFVPIISIVMHLKNVAVSVHFFSSQKQDLVKKVTTFYLIKLALKKYFSIKLPIKFLAILCLLFSTRFFPTKTFIFTKSTRQMRFFEIIDIKKSPSTM